MLLGFNDKKDSSGHSILPLTIKRLPSKDSLTTLTIKLANKLYFPV